MSDSDKAAILDWLLAPTPSGRDDRPDRIDRTINKNQLQTLLVFRAWCTPEQALEAIKQEMARG